MKRHLVQIKLDEKTFREFQQLKDQYKEIENKKRILEGKSYLLKRISNEKMLSILMEQEKLKDED